MREECGVFGIYSAKKQSDLALDAYFALYALQHRGQESCGIAVCDDGVINYHRDLGLVPHVFSREQLDKLGYGNMAVGHVRYATNQTKSRSNAQPLVIRHVKGNLALCHNGALTNAPELQSRLEMEGHVFHSNNDIEIISYIITKCRIKAASIENAVELAMNEIQGAYSLVIMSPSKLIAARDPNGFRPLCIGERDGEYIFASETCALDSLDAKFVRDVEPGEVVVVDKDGLRSIKTHVKGKSTFCIFEYLYFARPDSTIAGISVHEARLRAGAFLALEHPVQADVVIGVPDSGLDAALGFSRQSGIPYGVGFIKNRYIDRTFIKPTQKERAQSVRIKLNAVEATVKDKRVVLVDDSIVRGTTGGRIVKLLKDAGAKEVHLRISCPPFLNPCYFGTDIDSRDKLIACKMTNGEICDFMGADSIGFVSKENIHMVAQGCTCGLCTACFDGNYPIPEPAERVKSKYDKKISEGAGENE